MQLSYWLDKFDGVEHPDLLLTPGLAEQAPELLRILQDDHAMLAEAMDALRNGRIDEEQTCDDASFPFYKARIADKFSFRFGLSPNGLYGAKIDQATDQEIQFSEDGELITVTSRWLFSEGKPWLQNHIIDDGRMDRIVHAEVRNPQYEWDQTTTTFGGNILYTGKHARQKGSWHGVMILNN